MSGAQRTLHSQLAWRTKNSGWPDTRKELRNGELQLSGGLGRISEPSCAMGSVATLRWFSQNTICKVKRLHADLLLTYTSREGTDNPPNAKSVLSLGIPVPSTIPQLSPSQRIYGKSDRPDEITACALSLVRQIRNPHHPFRSSAAHTFATFAIHGTFLSNIVTNSLRQVKISFVKILVLLLNLSFHNRKITIVIPGKPLDIHIRC